MPASNVGDSSETAGVKPEEGGDDVKSSWPLCPGLHTSYNGAYKGKRTCEGKQIPKSAPQFGLQAETRLHEAGIASNRGQHTAVNVFLSLVHTARQATKVGGRRSRLANLREASAEPELRDWD